MITVGDYVKDLLNKKGITQATLLRRMNELGLGDKGRIMKKQHLNNAINNKIIFTPFVARKIEIALELPQYALVKMIGFPKTEFEMNKLENIKPIK